MTDSGPSEADVRFRLVEQRYGSRLTADELREIRRVVNAIVRAAEAMRSAALDNSAEPFRVFAPFRKQG